jgi:hypothetical protein
MHPELYWAGMKTMLKLGMWAKEKMDEELLLLIRHWASVYNVATVMCNRSTPPHRDPRCPPEAFDIMTSFGPYGTAFMKIPNFGIKLAYNSGTMVAACCRVARHAVDLNTGDRIMWAWYMRDTVHNFVKIARPGYARRI